MAKFTESNFHLPITEEWLKAVGFKWHQLDRQPYKHWLLWLGDTLGGGWSSFEDLGVEVSIASWKNRAGDDIGRVGEWNCWLRSDAAGRYHRFIHIRYLKTAVELIELVEALTGQEWDPANNLYGSMLRPDLAARRRREMERLDIKHNITERPNHLKWHEIEKDDSRGRALPEHYEAHEQAKKEREE